MKRFILGFLCFGSALVLSQAGPPNIVLILADDLGRECLECYGGESYPTPNLNRLAEEGTRFEACYATPMCSPTRVMLMTGRHSFRNYTEWGRMDLDQSTLATELKKAGYATAIFGKWHLGGWDAAPFGPTRVGFDRFATFDYEKVVREGGEIGNQYWSTEVWEDGRNFRLDGYAPAYYHEHSIDFIRRHGGSENASQPFFLYYPLVHAHRPFVPDDETEASAADQTAKNGKLEHFPAMVTYIDKVVGEIIETLGSSGQLENTVVIFSSDNGTDNVNEAKELRSKYRGIKVPGGKYLPTDLGANVPLLVRGPGVRAGRVVSAPVDFSDLMPTFCEIAKMAPPKVTDGQSLWTMLQGGPETSHDGLAITWGVFEHSSKKYKDPRTYRDELIHLVRDERWKLLSTGALFDLKSDWQETQPLPAETEPEAKKRLQAALDHWQRATPRLW